MAVGVSHQLIGLLAGGVQAHRVVHRLTLVKGKVAITAVDRTAGGIHQMANTVMATALQDVSEAHQVALDVRGRVLQRITHPRLGSEINHHRRSLRSEQVHQRIAVLQ